ncbi:MAG: hypothetical protein BWY09_01592 [Candidatus Hydrogenedentes bacterium ADurb.Bin179]|nr:MAG: hypothetical protein BWY09_01592 [Candidatus Hydrogenedentes bacterium ADurb.Bin179]
MDILHQHRPGSGLTNQNKMVVVDKGDKRRFQRDLCRRLHADQRHPLGLRGMD